MKSNIAILFVAALVALTPSSTAQDLTFFFSAGDFSEDPDRFGNTHTIGQEDAILQLPFGHEDLLNTFIESDNKWLIYEVLGNTLLVSNNPAGSEDSPEIFMDITVAIGGTYEVILNFLDNNDFPGEGPILAALGDGALIDYSELNSIRATGGTSPAYPVSGNTTAGTMWWQSVSLGETEAEAGGVIRVRIDDAPNPVPDIGAFEYAASVFQGITLRVIELRGTISEIQVSPGVFDWATDASGNQFKTGPVDASLTQDQWLTVNANSGTDSLWNTREGLGSYGPILESFPLSGEDSTPLQTSVIFAKGGTYDVFFSLGDTGAVDADENIQNSTPLNFALEGEDFVRWHANDGEYKGTPGYNDYEMSVGQITVSAGDQVNFLIDDVQDGTASRSVYLGMRLAVAKPSPAAGITIVNNGDGKVTLTWTGSLQDSDNVTGPYSDIAGDSPLTVNADQTVRIYRVQ